MNHTADASPPKRRRRVVVAPVLALFLLFSGCGTGAPSSPTDAPIHTTGRASAGTERDTRNAEHPDVIAAELTSEDNGTWSLEVTLSSQYDSPERYADGWRVLDEDGTLLGEHTLTHDHADEQPVTRTQTGLKIPDGVDAITLQGKDTDNGYGGKEMMVDVSR